MKIRYIEINNFRGIRSLEWHIKGDFICIIGPGDTCKTTILTALDYALSPRQTLYFDDLDFFEQNIENNIEIQVTLTDWDNSREDIKAFFSERKFGQCKSGISHKGPTSEPDDMQEAITISLEVDKNLEPKWFVVKKCDDGEHEKKAIYASDRAILGVSKIDTLSDPHFTWGRNTILTRLSRGIHGNLNEILSELSRELRLCDISQYQNVSKYLAIAQVIQAESKKIGVKLTNLTPKIDIQKQSISTGALSLHENNIPLKNKGNGSKKLISCAMHMKLHDGKNALLIDEIETGLEPHRIRGLIYKLKNSGQQIFTTSHSPVVIRELEVKNNELYICKKTEDNGVVSLANLKDIPNIQGDIRTNAEAFLGSKIIVCEGATEIGCLRALDVFYFKKEEPPVWSLATSYLDARGIDKIKNLALSLDALGYRVAVFCDNDEPNKFTDSDKNELISKGIKVFQWEKGKSTEQQIFSEIPWEYIVNFLSNIVTNHDLLTLESIVDAVNSKLPESLKLSANFTELEESVKLRDVFGETAKNHTVNAKAKGWIKRIDYAEKAFDFLLPKLESNSFIKKQLSEIWNWIQND